MIQVVNLCLITHHLNLDNMNEKDKLLKLIRYLIIGSVLFFFLTVIMMTCSVTR